MSHLTYRLALILLFLTQIYLPSIVYGEERDLITDFGFSSGFYTAAPFLRYEKYNPPEYFSASARTCEREKSIFADSGQLLLVPGLSRDNSAGDSVRFIAHTMLILLMVGLCRKMEILF